MSPQPSYHGSPPPFQRWLSAGESCLIQNHVLHPLFSKAACIRRLQGTEGCGVHRSLCPARKAIRDPAFWSRSLRCDLIAAQLPSRPNGGSSSLTWPLTQSTAQEGPSALTAHFLLCLVGRILFPAPWWEQAREAERGETQAAWNHTKMAFFSWSKASVLRPGKGLQGGSPCSHSSLPLIGVTHSVYYSCPGLCAFQHVVMYAMCEVILFPRK